MALNTRATSKLLTTVLAPHLSEHGFRNMDMSLDISDRKKVESGNDPAGEKQSLIGVGFEGKKLGNDLEVRVVEDGKVGNNTPGFEIGEIAPPTKESKRDENDDKGDGEVDAKRDEEIDAEGDDEVQVEKYEHRDLPHATQVVTNSEEMMAKGGKQVSKTSSGNAQVVKKNSQDRQTFSSPSYQLVSAGLEFDSTSASPRKIDERVEQDLEKDSKNVKKIEIGEVDVQDADANGMDIIGDGCNETQHNSRFVRPSTCQDLIRRKFNAPYESEVDEDGDHLMDKYQEVDDADELVAEASTRRHTLRPSRQGRRRSEQLDMEGSCDDGYHKKNYRNSPERRGRRHRSEIHGVPSRARIRSRSRSPQRGRSRHRSPSYRIRNRSSRRHERSSRAFNNSVRRSYPMVERSRRHDRRGKDSRHENRSRAYKARTYRYASDSSGDGSYSETDSHSEAESLDSVEEVPSRHHHGRRQRHTMENNSPVQATFDEGASSTNAVIASATGPPLCAVVPGTIPFEKSMTHLEQTDLPLILDDNTHPTLVWNSFLHKLETSHMPIISWEWVGENSNKGNWEKRGLVDDLVQESLGGPEYWEVEEIDAHGKPIFCAKLQIVLPPTHPSMLKITLPDNHFMPSSAGDAAWLPMARAMDGVRVYQTDEWSKSRGDAQNATVAHAIRLNALSWMCGSKVSLASLAQSQMVAPFTMSAPGKLEFMASHVVNPKVTQTKAERRRQNAIKQEVSNLYSAEGRRLLEAKRKLQIARLEEHSEGMYIKKTQIEPVSAETKQETKGIKPPVCVSFPSFRVGMTASQSEAVRPAASYARFGSKAEARGITAVKQWVDSQPVSSKKVMPQFIDRQGAIQSPALSAPTQVQGLVSQQEGFSLSFQQPVRLGARRSTTQDVTQSKGPSDRARQPDDERGQEIDYVRQLAILSQSRDRGAPVYNLGEADVGGVCLAVVIGGNRYKFKGRQYPTLEEAKQSLSRKVIDKLNAERP